MMLAFTKAYREQIPHVKDNFLSSDPFFVRDRLPKNPDRQWNYDEVRMADELFPLHGYIIYTYSRRFWNGGMWTRPVMISARNGVIVGCTNKI
jgi:hypothetical protein